jgi:hypothetical protein
MKLDPDELGEAELVFLHHFTNCGILDVSEFQFLHH